MVLNNKVSDQFTDPSNIPFINKLKILPLHPSEPSKLNIYQSVECSPACSRGIQSDFRLNPLILLVDADDLLIPTLHLTLDFWI